jgi:tRNA A37 methylthiotransferase MiaB
MLALIAVYKSNCAILSLEKHLHCCWHDQIALSTDMIVGFCGETEEDHRDTLDLLQSVAYDQAFLFAYSQRNKTYAARHLKVCPPPTPISLKP